MTPILLDRLSSEASEVTGPLSRVTGSDEKASPEKKVYLQKDDSIKDAQCTSGRVEIFSDSSESSLKSVTGAVSVLKSASTANPDLCMARWKKKGTGTCENVQKLLIEKTDLCLPLATAQDSGLGMAATVKCKIHVGLTADFKIPQQNNNLRDMEEGKQEEKQPVCNTLIMEMGWKTRKFNHSLAFRCDFKLKLFHSFEASNLA
ncbi:hypothetical protein HGM15179_008889 [Zosterops borbonicus]|uniref:Uncharacterized protein n=1 Tax=Zosterops borbonicus TaxID=364589 RepID=A0A8K1GHB2_9PASS|nr:hypothetical protein HGM15179_008889 [Zosterops borbonicus]